MAEAEQLLDDFIDTDTLVPCNQEKKCAASPQLTTLIIMTKQIFHGLISF